MSGVRERFAEVNGVRLHYRIAGTGSPVVLLHGYTQTGHMWHPILPSLAERHTVIVPDLRGAGGSAKPDAGYDKKTLAADIQALTASLGFDRVRIAGKNQKEIVIEIAELKGKGYPAPVDLDTGAGRGKVNSHRTT